MSNNIVFDAAQAVRDNLKQFLREQECAKPDHYGPNFTQACDAEAAFDLYFGENYSRELFRPESYLDFSQLLFRARELGLVTPEQDDMVCAALGEIWDSLSTPEQIELESKVAAMKRY